MFIADLHIHSRFSRACSKDCDIEHLSWWARRKGLSVLGTGDFTHPAWAAELKDTLVEAEPGLFRVRPELEQRLDRDTPASCTGTVRFMLSVDDSSTSVNPSGSLATMQQTREDTMTQVRDQQRSTADTSAVATSVGILYRVSSDGQDEENQVPELEAHCDDKGYRINRRYPLHDKSAYHGDHAPDLEKILKDVSNGIIKVVVMVHSSRLDRRDPDEAEFYHLSIRQAGGSLESVREPLFGKSDISGRVVTMLAQYANHQYSETLSGHIRAGHNRVRANRANGTGLLGRAPFGYEIEGVKYHKVLVPSAIGLKYIPEIYNRIIKGDSLATVAKWLNSENVPTGCKINKSGEPTKGWTASTVRQIIRNTVYKGQMRDSNHDVVGTCEAIITAVVFRQASERLDNFPKRGPENIANKLLLVSHLFCVKCKSPMYKSQAAPTRIYYRCWGEKHCCMIRASVLDTLVDEAIAADHNPVLEFRLIPGKNYDDDLDLIKAQIKALASDVDADDYDERHAALMAERKRLKDLDTMPDEWREEPTGETYGAKWKSADFAGKRAILNDVKVYAGKNERNEAYAIIEITGKLGVIRQLVAGNPPGPTLLERAQAKGLDKLVDADADVDG